MLTILANHFFQSRIKQIERTYTDAPVIQEKLYEKLIQQGKNTCFGEKYGFKNLDSYSKFAKVVPLQSYEQIQNYIERTLQGEKNLLWPEKIKWFAQSSGTTGAKSKFIPISNACYHSMHLQGAIDTIAIYLHLNPASRFFSGKALAIGAGKSKKNEYGMNIGLLSGILNERMSLIAKVLRTPDHKTAMLDDFELKMKQMIPQIIRQNIVSFSGIPSWYQVLFSAVQNLTGKEDLSEIWPNMEVFIHGGVSFEPYQKIFNNMFPNANLHYLEVYNASEGFFAFQNDFSDKSLLLMTDHGTFYEFIDIEDINSNAIPLWEVKKGVKYEMIITNNSGLWRYRIGDVVTFTSINPYKILICGRTKHFLNICGEELMVTNADNAIMIACNACNIHVLNYTATAIPPTKDKNAYHQWLIEFKEKPHDIREFQRILDQALCEQNSDYESKRKHNIALDMPEIVIARKNLFNDWLKSKDSSSGQEKIPRLIQNSNLFNELLSLNKLSV